MKNKIKVLLLIFFCFNILLIGALLYFLGPASFKSKDVSFIVEEGESLREIGSNLEKEGVVKNDKVFFLYAILKNARGIYAAKYDLNTNMRLSEVIKELKTGGKNADEITLTIKEGLNLRQIADVISKETDNSKEDVLNLAKDEKYIDELIKKYWFLTNEVKNKDVYYDLEGYLFPDSYNFYSKKVSVKEIFNTMLDEEANVLEKYKKDIEKNKLSAHQLITMASVVELEGLDKNSRKDVAGVFYNRLNSKMPLGSDVTTYYGVNKDMTSDLTNSELNTVNGYNTRVSSMAGKLPVGPICNPSTVSLEAALNPTKHDYYYFVADKNGKVYLTKNYETHNKVIADLKSKGLWYEW